MSWTSKFETPIALPSGRKLTTLRQAAEYMMQLPKAESEALAWQTAMHVLIQAADHGGPISFGQIGMMQALYPKGEPVYRPLSKDPKWRNGYKLVRDR